MEQFVLPSLLLTVIFSWEEIKSACAKLFALAFLRKSKYVSKIYLDQFVSDMVFVSTIPIGLMIIIGSSKNFSQTLSLLSIELASIFIFIEAARFVSRHTKIFAADSFSESAVMAVALIPKIYSPLRLARFYKYKFELGSKLILEILAGILLSLAAVIVIENSVPEISQQNFTALVAVLTPLSMSVIFLNHLHPRLHRSRHPFWTNFRLLAGIIVMTVIFMK